MRNHKDALLAIEGVYHSYLPGTPFERRSLDGVDLSVYEKETVGIIGPSGSGKTTLLFHCNGLLRPQRGTVRAFGIPIGEPGAELRDIRRRVGCVFQSPEDQVFERYVGDDIAFGPRNMGLAVETVRERVRGALATVGYPFSFKDRLTSRLSLGEKRRVAIAGVLAMDPRLLLLDEPTAGLDPEARRDLFEIIDRFKRRSGRAVLMVSHRMEEIAELSDRIYVLVRGRVVLQGTARGVFSRPDLLSENGLSLPAPAQTVRLLQERGIPVRSGACSVQEAADTIEELFRDRT
ncbi:MAG: energy-coupling factor transporter ATPase [Spirochaetes bacterium]|nr:energy-coupling factor transporter ATPase [Spirochaetota bacterium]